MPLADLVAFPLYPINPDSTCGCGAKTCQSAGKHPIGLWGQVQRGDPLPELDARQGYGIRTGAAPQGSGVFVVDCDSPEALGRFLALGDVPDTYTVRTGRAEGGFHLYFRAPADFRVKQSTSALAPKVDIKGEGGFVVGPGSLHVSGNKYEVVNERPPADAPAWLVDWLRQRPWTTEYAQPHEDDVPPGPERERRKERFAKYLQTAPPSIQGQAGDVALYKVVLHGAHDLRLPDADILALVREHFDPRCEPPWGDMLAERVLHKCASAKHDATRPRCEPVPADLEEFLLGSGVALKSPALSDLAPPGHFSATIKRGADWAEPYVRPPYLLEGLIPRETSTIFFAEGGSVKSWTAFALAISVATGTAWLGRYVVAPGKVLVLDYEDGWAEFRRRKEILTQKRPDVDLTNLEYLYAGPNIADVELWKWLARQGYALVVIDALNAAMPSNADENDQRFAEGLKLAGGYVEVTGSNVLTVHHANKQGGIRGSSTIRDQCDVVFRFEAISETETEEDTIKRMRMICDKPGPQRRPSAVNVEMSNAGLSTFEDEAHTAGVEAATPQDVGAAILLTIENHEVSGYRELVSLSGLSERAVKARLPIMIERGDVIKGGPKKRFYLGDDDSQRGRLTAWVRGAGRRARTVDDVVRGAAVTSMQVHAALDVGVLVWSSSGKSDRWLMAVDR
jgi:hypothetical protein